jgi:hypothetical protein
MTNDNLEALLRKARKAEPPPSLKALILQHAIHRQARDPSAAVVPFRSSPRWAWSLIAAGWVAILALWSTTPHPFPRSRSESAVSSLQHPNSADVHGFHSLHSHVFDLLPELGIALGLALDPAEALPVVLQPRSTF